MTYPQALQQLQYWLTNNQVSHANHLNFNAHPLSAAELQAIREYTQNRLPESYYLFLQQCGTGDFFYSWYTSKRRLGQDPTKLLNYTKCWVCNLTYILLKQAVARILTNRGQQAVVCISTNRVRGWCHTPYLRRHKL